MRCSIIDVRSAVLLNIGRSQMLVRFSISIGFSADLDFVGFSPDWRSRMFVGSSIVVYSLYCCWMYRLPLNGIAISVDVMLDVRWISVGFSLDVRRMLVGPFGKNCTNAGHIHSKNDSHAGHIHGKNDSES